MSKDLILQIITPPTEELELNIPKSDGTIAKLITNTTAVWQTKADFVPSRGTIIVYSDRNVINGSVYPGVKIGDGQAYVADLPFVGEEITEQIIEDLNQHIADQSVHVTSEERAYWNGKLNAELDGENLIFSSVPST